MKIYTKQGDHGESSLLFGKKVKKNHPRLNAYGTADELNSFLALALSKISKSFPQQKKIFSLLERIQCEIFTLGAELATPSGTKTPSNILTSTHIQFLEEEIDLMQKTLPKLRSFILPGSGAASSALHVCRSVCRRLERILVTLAQEETIRPEILSYINRLSDFLFVLARWTQKLEHIPEKPWNQK